MPATPTQIFERLREHRRKIVSLGVERIGVFGSLARGEGDRNSDVDILVEFAPGRKTFDAFIRLSFLLEEIVDRPVEVITTAALSPYNRSHVLDEVEYVDLTD